MNCRTAGGRVWLATLALVTMATAPALGQSSELRIAVIDVQKILTESVVGKQVLAELQKLRDERAAQLEGRQKELAELRKRYDETRLTLAEDKIAEMEKEIEDRTIALRRAQDDAQRELQKRQQEDFGQIEGDVMPIIVAVGQEFGYSLIFNKFESGLVFADESIDVTNLVIERYNAANPASAPGN